MNLFGWIILVALVGEYILQVVTVSLNLKSLGSSPPAELREIYPGETWRKTRDYLREKARFSLVRGGADLLIVLLFWFAKGFPFLESVCQEISSHPVVKGLVFFAIIGAAKFLLSLPFNVWFTFVLEERFGFNRTTWKTFVLDNMKIIALSILIGGPVAAIILSFFVYAGSLAWLYAWAASAGLIFLFSYIFPKFILPLFHRFKPLEEGELKKEILDYASRVDFPVENIYVMDGSRRSEKANAFFTGTGKAKKIALFDTLISRHPPGEIVAILAHEIGHFKKGHVKKGMAISIIHAGILFFLLSIFLKEKGLFNAFFVAEPSVHAGFIFFGLLYSPIELVLSLFLNALSRKHEREADRFAASTCDDPTALARALKRLYGHNLSHPCPHPVAVFVGYSHPPLIQRIREILKGNDGKGERGG